MQENEVRQHKAYNILHSDCGTSLKVKTYVANTYLEKLLFCYFVNKKEIFILLYILIFSILIK